MTKREEIEEGLKAFLQGVAHNGYYDGLEVRLREELDSQGCVLQVEGELPIPVNKDALRCLEQLLEDGWHKTEPLVEG